MNTYRVERKMLEEVKENPFGGSTPPVKSTKSSCIGTVKKVNNFYKSPSHLKAIKCNGLLDVEERDFRANVVLEDAGRR